MTIKAMVLTAMSAVLMSLPGVGRAEDGFIAIHNDNQKIGAAVYIYWRIQSALGEVPTFLADVPEAELAGVWAAIQRLTEASPRVALSCSDAKA